MIYALSICVLFTIKLDQKATRRDAEISTAQAYTRRLAEERFADYRQLEVQRADGL